MLRLGTHRFVQRSMRATGMNTRSAIALRPSPLLLREQCAGFATIYDNKMPYGDINRHRSDAEQRIAKVPVVEVEGNVAVCDGGGGALGHPLEYIQLDTVKHHTAQTCKYCGIQYKMKEGFHDHH